METIPVMYRLLKANYADVILLYKKKVGKYLLWDILYCDSL